MKAKIFIIVLFLLSVANGYSQFKINADGSAQFKVGSYNAGFTGSSSSYSSNVSFGYKALNNPSVTLNISGSELKAGTYLYSLIVNGKKVDTKRMILTK